MKNTHVWSYKQTAKTGLANIRAAAIYHLDLDLRLLIGRDTDLYKSDALDPGRTKEK